MKVNKWTVATKQPSYVCPYGPAGCADPKFVTKKQLKSKKEQAFKAFAFLSIQQNLILKKANLKKEK